MAYQDILRRSPLFAGVPADVLQAAVGSSVRCHVKRGQMFFRSGESASRLFVLMDGRVKLHLITTRGYRVLFRLLSPGDVFGYQAAIGDSAHYYTTAQAAVDSEALGWSGSATRRLLRSYPVVALNALSISLGRMQEYQERLSDMACETAATRIARQLVRLGSPRGLGLSSSVTINGDFTREDLAGLAGSTLHTVSRVLGRWERARIVEKSRGMVRITAPAKLAAIAGLRLS